jgi:hypothetical protein
VRGGATRPLAVGAEIFGDDEVVVGADGSVGIDLAHNHARWTLEANRRGKVRESAAWTMAKVDAPAKPVEHATSAAGREGERTAGTSSTTESAAAPAPAEAAPAPAAALPRPATSAKPPAQNRRADAKGDGLGSIGTTGHGPGGGGMGMGGGAGGSAALGTSTGTRRSPAPADKLQADEESSVNQQRKEVMPPAPPPPPPPQPDAADQARQDQIKKTMLAQRSTLMRCKGAAGLTVRIDVSQSLAKVTIVGGTPADAKATVDCMNTALAQLKLQQASLVSVTLKL